MQCLRTGIGLAAIAASLLSSSCTGAIGPDGERGGGAGPMGGGPGQSPPPGGGGNRPPGTVPPPGTGPGPSTVPGAPAAGQLRRLSAAQFRRALQDLVGATAALPQVEESPASASLRSIGSSITAVSPRGVEQFESAVEAALEPTFADPRRVRRRRVLDTVAEDARALRTRLGADDSRRLDQHLEGIQQLEKRIGAMSAPAVGPAGPACAIPADASGKYPPLLPDNNGLVTPEQNEAMAELVTYALACDLTRVFLFQHGRPAAHYNMRVIGINNNIHDDVSHQEPGDQPNFNRAVLYWMDQFRVFLEKLQNTPDGAGNLLENGCIYATSDVSLGRTHSALDLPVLIFGRAGGAIRGDQHHRAEKDNVSKVLFTLVNLFGGNVTEFGAGGGRVTGGIPEILA